MTNAFSTYIHAGDTPYPISIHVHPNNLYDRGPPKEQISFDGFCFRWIPGDINVGLVDDCQAEIRWSGGDGLDGTDAEMSHVRWTTQHGIYTANPNSVVSASVQIGQVHCEENGWMNE